MLKPEILNHWIVPQQGKNPSEIDEEPKQKLNALFAVDHMLQVDLQSAHNGVDSRFTKERDTWTTTK
jgi:hypothetical protein